MKKQYLIKLLKYIAFAIGWACLLTIWYFYFFINLPHNSPKEEPNHIDSTSK